jgi:hypothetical protein
MTIQAFPRSPGDRLLHASRPEMLKSGMVWGERVRGEKASQPVAVAAPRQADGEAFLAKPI